MKMQLKELNTPHGTLQYRIEGGVAAIAGYRGKDTQLIIPALIDRKSVV